VSVFEAGEMVRRTSERLLKRTGRRHWDLIRDLVWLASGDQADLDERSVRRYLEERSGAKSPAAAYWRRNWPLLREVARLAPEKKRDLFEAAAKRYLDLPLQ
jgi:hypothetical protein